MNNERGELDPLTDDYAERFQQHLDECPLCEAGEPCPLHPGLRQLAAETWGNARGTSPLHHHSAADLAGPDKPFRPATGWSHAEHFAADLVGPDDPEPEGQQVVVARFQGLGENGGDYVATVSAGELDAVRQGQPLEMEPLGPEWLSLGYATEVTWEGSVFRPDVIAEHWRDIAAAAQHELSDQPGSALDAFELRVMALLNTPTANLDYYLRRALGRYERRAATARSALREAARHTPKRRAEEVVPEGYSEV